MAKRRRLDRGQVVEKAAALADAAGDVQALSLTALAAALDIRVPSLYNHVAGMEDLQAALALYAMQRLTVCLRGAVGGQSGEEALIALAFAYRRFAQEHPGIYPLTLRAPAHNTAPLMARANDDAPLMARANDDARLMARADDDARLMARANDDAPLIGLAQELLQMLYLLFASFGVRGEDAVHAVRGLRALLHGFTTLETAGAFKMPIDLDESFRRLITTYLAGLG